MTVDARAHEAQVPDLLSTKPDYTPHTRGPGREQPAFWAVDNHAYQERRHATPFNGDSHFK